MRSQKIFANITTRLVGRIQSSAVDPFVDRFKYPYEIIQNNSTEAFYPTKSGIYSQWLLDDLGKLTFCRYYPAYCLLAAVANNPSEQELRTLFLKKYQDNPILGLVHECLTEYFKGNSSPKWTDSFDAGTTAY